MRGVSQVQMTVDEAYAFCRAIAHKHGANFSVGFRFLPRTKRRAVYAAYAYCRWADDIADESDPVILSREDGEGPVGHVRSAESTGPSPSSRLSRMTGLDDWQRELDLCYAGEPAHPITIALADGLKHFAIPKSAFVALIDGCRQDTIKSRYENFAELLHYCELVAASISDISLSIFGYRSDSAIEHGRHLSTALQLTNVTRDVGDDLSRDRIYVPQEDLRRFNVAEKEIFDRCESDRMRALIEFQIERAESYFRAAEPLLDELDFDARFPVLLMGGVYATVLGKLKKNPLMAIRERLSLSTLQKMLVVGTRVLRPHFV
jgi:phytoene synthase